MHSKSTVRYICEQYTATGNRYFYKLELLTMGNWNQIESLYWSRPKPITERTFLKAQKEGYKCEVKTIKTKPALIVQIGEVQRSGRKRQKAYQRHGESSARIRRLLHY